MYFQSKPTDVKRKVQTIFLIGDENANKSEFFHLLDLEEEELEEEVNVYVKWYLSKDHCLQIYDFPSSRYLKSFHSLYFKILGTPSLIFYFMKPQNSHKQIFEWVRQFANFSMAPKVVFVSEVTTYLERQNVIGIISGIFDGEVKQNIVFLDIEPNSLFNVLVNIDRSGIYFDEALMKKSFIYKVSTRIKGIIKKVKGAVGRYQANRQVAQI